MMNLEKRIDLTGKKGNPYHFYCNGLTYVVGLDYKPEEYENYRIISNRHLMGDTYLYLVDELIFTAKHLLSLKIDVVHCCISHKKIGWSNKYRAAKKAEFRREKERVALEIAESILEFAYEAGQNGKKELLEKPLDALKHEIITIKGLQSEWGKDEPR